jgi:hypothetical protein
VRPDKPDWNAALITGASVEAAFLNWIAMDGYRSRVDGSG